MAGRERKEVPERRVNINVNSKLLDKYMDVLVSYQYSCKRCNHVSEDRKSFYRHCLHHFIRDRTCQPVNVYLCSQCCTAFNTLQETRKHMKEAHKNSGTSDQNSQVVHVEVDKIGEKRRQKYKTRPKEKFACPHKGCKVSFSKEADLEVHGTCHLPGEGCTLWCPHCSLLFPSWPPCVMHLWKAHQVDCGLLQCSVCQTYRTWAPLTLENHMRVHADLRAFVCKTCGKTFKQPSQLRNHNATHTDTQHPKWNKWKQCSMCFKIYSNAKALKKHKEEVHNRLRPFVCNVCGHASARRCLLTLHQRQHSGDKPHVCSLCPYTTADLSSLARHRMRHTGVRLYHCPECSFSSNRSSNFKTHVMKTHPGLDILHMCSRCPYKTVSLDRYTRHVSDHLTGLIPSVDGEGGEGEQQLLLQFPAWASSTK